MNSPVATFWFVKETDNYKVFDVTFKDRVIRLHLPKQQMISGNLSLKGYIKDREDWIDDVHLDRMQQEIEALEEKLQRLRNELNQFRGKC